MRKCALKLIMLVSISIILAACNSNNEIAIPNDPTEIHSTESVTTDENTSENITESEKQSTTNVTVSDCNTEETILEMRESSEVNKHIKNAVVKQPVLNNVTFEISGKLVGRYEVKGFPDAYFEIKPNGQLQITVITFDGVAEYKNSDNLVFTAFYNADTETIICFNLIGGTNTFPGGNLSIEFVGDCDCTYFRKIDEYYEKEKYLKVD